MTGEPAVGPPWAERNTLEPTAEAYGVTDYTPADGAERLAEALNGRRWHGTHGDRPAFGHEPLSESEWDGG
jgi:hypothetical protein